VLQAGAACGVRWLASKSITWQMQEGKATLHIFEGKEKCKAKAKLRGKGLKFVVFCISNLASNLIWLCFLIGFAKTQCWFVDLTSF